MVDAVRNGPGKNLLDSWKEDPLCKEQGHVDHRRKEWQRHRLEPIWEFLTDEQKDEFGTDASVGQHPDFVRYSDRITPEPDKTVLKDGLVPEKVFDTLIRHAPSEWSKSDHAVLMKFQTYVEENPKEYSKRAGMLHRLPAEYTSRFFSGLEKNLGTDAEIHWKEVLELCSSVALFARKSVYWVGREESVKRMLDLIRNALAMGVIDFSLREDVWKIIKMTLGDKNDNDPYADEIPDYTLISMQTVRGMTFHSMLRYVIWCYRHQKHGITKEALDVLTAYMGNKTQHSVSCHAALGYFFTILYDLDKSTMASCVDTLFKNDDMDLSKAAWHGYLDGYFSDDVFCMLHAEYRGYVKKLGSDLLKDGGLPHFDQKIIDHVTFAYLCNLANSHIVFDDMMIGKNPNVLSHCSNYVWLFLKDYGSDPMFDRNRLYALWNDGRLGDAIYLGFWAQYSPFSTKETLMLIRNSLQNYSPKSHLDIPILIDELTRHADSHPDLALECLDLIIAMDDPETIALSKLDGLFKELLKAPSTREKATGLIHSLGEMGFNEFKHLL